jgi:hypothetical protein
MDTHSPFNLVVALSFMLSGLVIFWLARRVKPTIPERESKEFMPSEFSPKTLRFGGAGLFLLGLLILVGYLLHLF